MAEVTQTGATAPGGGAEHVGFPPFDTTTYGAQLLWLAITFGALYVLLSKLVLPQLSGIIEGRRSTIARDLDEAEAMKTRAEEAGAAYEKSLSEAKGKAQKLAQETRDRLAAESDAKRKTIEADGWGQIGVPQGAPEDELPGARMLHDLLMLGESAPRVIAFALEQEVDYYAPAFRGPRDAADPVIKYREPSDTPVDRSKSTARLLADERRWMMQQIAWNRGLIAQFRELAGQVADGVIFSVLCPLPFIRRAMERIAAGAARIGRDLAGFDVVAYTHYAIGPDAARAVAEVLGLTFAE